MGIIIVRLIDMPVAFKAFTIKDADDNYNIYVNARLDADTRANAYRHEIEHIRLGHFYQERPVADMEKEAEQYVKTNEDEERQVDVAGVRLHGSTRRSAL